MNIKTLYCAAIMLGIGTFGAARLHATEFGENTPYYEDDALLDVTEWFDGNDYNPTDEAWWRWDDETYEAAEDTSGDRDSDWYGYTARDDNDWFYDYYDPYPFIYVDPDNDGVYSFGSRYYDYDNDGTYDAFVSYSDWDGDGTFEDYDYYAFADTGTDKQKQQIKEQRARESRQQTVSGKVQKTKLVQVGGGKQHVVVAMQPQSGRQDQLLIADLGNAEDLKNVNPKLGDTITVKGPKAMVGKQAVVLAHSIELNGKTTQVNRNPRSITGTVLSTKNVNVRGNEHLMAIVQTKQKDKIHKIAVDLGRADRLKMDVKKGSSLTFSGFAVKVKDKSLMVAQSVKQDDKLVQINRQPDNPADQAQPAAGGEKKQK